MAGPPTDADSFHSLHVAAIIEEHKQFLIERIEPDYGLLDKLCEHNALSRMEISDVKALNSPYRKNSAILDFIVANNQYHNFIQALRDSRQKHIVNFFVANGQSELKFGGDWPLTEKEFTIIEANKSSLIDLLEPGNLIHLLYTKGVICSRQRDTISSKPTAHEKNEILLDILSRRSLLDYHTTIFCLQATNQTHVSPILNEGGAVVRVHAELQGEDFNHTENELISRITELLNGRSPEDSSRILDFAQLRIIGTKKGQSVVLYIFSKTVFELLDLKEMHATGDLKKRLVVLFTQIVSRSQYVEVSAENLSTVFESVLEEQLHRTNVAQLAVAVSDEEFETGLSYFTVLGYSATPSPRSFHLAAQVELNRNRKQSLKPTLRSYRSALDHVTEGLKVYAADQDLVQRKKQLDEEMRKLQFPSSPYPRQRSKPIVNLKQPPQVKKSEEESIRTLDLGYMSASSSTKMEHETRSDFSASDESISDYEETADDDDEREWDEEIIYDKELDYNMDYDSELDYDSDLEDAMTVWDSDEEEREEQHKEDDQFSKREPYYATASESQLWNLLRDDPDMYKLCSIQLDGPFAAKCKVLEKNPKDNIREIVIRGRMNCGQTLDGDEVVVEVKSTEVLDSEEVKVSAEKKSMTMPSINEELCDVCEQVCEGIKSLEQKGEVKIETRGVVKGIIRKTLNRKAYTFLCRADRYLSHLMKPLDGNGPAFHITPKLIDCVAVCAMIDGVPKCRRFVKLDPLKRESTLFVVRYLKWPPECKYPLGYVSHVIRTGETFARSQQIINVLHQVPTKPNPACDEAASKMDVYIPQHEDDTWKDLRKLFVVSIDPPNCKDVDNALSVEQIGEGEFRVGVHIADVTHYVDKDDVIDKNARRRGTSYYAATGKVYGMLPTRLSEDIVSLREGEERRVLSVIFHITKQKGIVRKPEIFRSVINNRKQLTYEAAEAYIDKIGSNRSMKWKENDLECAISRLHLIAVELRKNRIGDGRFFYKSDKPFEMEYPYEAHRLVEEFMILTNRYIGSFLENKFPGCIPLCLQDPPSEEDLDMWKDANSLIVLRSFYFRRYAALRPGNEFADSAKNVPILMSTLDAIVSAAEAGDLKKIKTLIGSEDFHPLHRLAMASWYSIQEKDTFSCSMENQTEAIKSSEKAALENQGNSDLSSGNSNIGSDVQNAKSAKAKVGHFSLQLQHYVQFSAPIQRFMGIVIHRFVKAALDGEPAPYTYDEIQTICESTNKIRIRSRRYDKACIQLKSTVLLQEPFRIPFIVENFDSNAISLTTPYLSHLRREQRSIAYSSLIVSKKPKQLENELTLAWERRFYDERVSFSIARTTAQSNKVLELDSEQHSAQVDSATWASLQQLVKSNASVQHNFRQLIQILVDKDKQRKQGLSKRLEITSEMKPDQSLVKYHVRFQQTLRRGTVLQVQVGAECLKGYLQPVCQLLQLTNEKDICLQHGRDPVKYFAKLATETVVTRYESAEQYKRVWLPIINMEAATQAAAAEDAILCNNVPIKFLRRNDKYYGTLKLPLDFCRKRQIKIFTAEDDDYDSNDYMCIRYHRQHPPPGPNTSSISCVQNKIWVAHVVSTKSKIDMEDIGGVASHDSLAKDAGRQMVFLDFIVQHHNGPIPSELLVDENFKMCTAEFLTKPLLERRMEAAVTAIDEASELCVSIVLKTAIPRDADIEMPESDNYDIETDAQGVPRNNRTQIKAIKRALWNPFTVIQGPPGTGKTVTGVKLIYWFAKANKLLRDGEVRPQILYCAPSNSAVDVATSLLMKYLGTNQRLKIVRVYSDMVVRQLFPIPRDATQTWLQKGIRYDLMVNENQRDIALHHLIRKPHNTHSEKLKQFDAMFARNTRTPEKVSDKDVEDYLKLVTTACVEELPKYDVVFCTCAASSSKKMRLGTQIRQIIIDECGMCMEPESLIPLVCYKEAKQVVLIGDHKQLQPIVMCGMAGDLGMQKSLFERYEDQAIMLDEQYRMHPSICEFPSEAFYDSKLRTATLLMERQWTLAPIWSNCSHPCTVFIHVEGKDEENRHSKSNEAERDEVTRIFAQLVNQCHVLKDNIAILSQYKAQCSEIQKNLKQIGFQTPRVHTVVASQGGEWQYVILSLVRSIPRYEIETKPSEGWCKRNMGFIIDRHQINVALTRAKIGLIIVGNKHLLRCDSMWRELLEHYDKRRCLLEVKKFIPEYMQI